MTIWNPCAFLLSNIYHSWKLGITAQLLSSLICCWLNLPNLEMRWKCRNFKLLGHFLGLFPGTVWLKSPASSLLPPPLQIHGGGHVSGPVAVGRVPGVTGFSAFPIESPGARNVWKLKTDVHIISPSFTCLHKPIPPVPDLLLDMLLISPWDSAPVDRHLTTFLPCRTAYMCSRVMRKKCLSGKPSKSESKHQIHIDGFTFFPRPLWQGCNI